MLRYIATHTSTNPSVPDFHHCSKHVENNLLAKFKYGDQMREHFRRAVYSFHSQEKEQHLQEIGKLSIGARTYCEDIDQHLLFRCDAKYPKYNVYTNQPTECLNWVFLPARRKTRFLLLKTIEGWFLKQLAERKRAHTERLVTGNYISDYCHRE